MLIRQVVQVEILNAVRKYTYEYHFDVAAGIQPLRIGDRVELPPNQVQEEGSAGTVVALGSDYEGPMKAIVRKIGDHKGAGDVDLWGDMMGQGDYA